MIKTDKNKASIQPVPQLSASHIPMSRLSLTFHLFLTENLREGSEKKVIFITGRVHPGETPSSFVCQGKLGTSQMSCTVMTFKTLSLQAKSLSTMAAHLSSQADIHSVFT
jgi:hypothetical protein